MDFASQIWENDVLWDHLWIPPSVSAIRSKSAGMQYVQRHIESLQEEITNSPSNDGSVSFTLSLKQANVLVLCLKQASLCLRDQAQLIRKSESSFKTVDSSTQCGVSTSVSTTPVVTVNTITTTVPSELGRPQTYSSVVASKSPVSSVKKAKSAKQPKPVAASSPPAMSVDSSSTKAPKVAKEAKKQTDGKKRRSKPYASEMPLVFDADRFCSSAVVQREFKNELSRAARTEEECRAIDAHNLHQYGDCVLCDGLYKTCSLLPPLEGVSRRVATNTQDKLVLAFHAYSWSATIVSFDTWLGSQPWVKPGETPTFVNVASSSEDPEVWSYIRKEYSVQGGKTYRREKILEAVRRTHRQQTSGNSSSGMEPV